MARKRKKLNPPAGSYDGDPMMTSSGGKASVEEAVLIALCELGESKTSAVAEHIGVTLNNTRNAVQRLKRQKHIRMKGKYAGATWTITKAGRSRVLADPLPENTVVTPATGQLRSNSLETAIQALQDLGTENEVLRSKLDRIRAILDE